MKKKRILNILAAVVLGTAVVAGSVIVASQFADPRTTLQQTIEIKQINEPVSPKESVFAQWGLKCVYPASITINGTENRLLMQFADQQQAMEKIKTCYPDFLRVVAQKFSLQPLSDSNWKDYQNHLRQYTCGALPEDLGGEKNLKPYQEMQLFFAFYEDKGLNEELLSRVHTMNILFDLHYHSPLEPFVVELPYDSPTLRAFPHNSVNGGLL